MISNGLAIKEGLSVDRHCKPGSVKVLFEGRMCLINQSSLIIKPSPPMATMSEELLMFLMLAGGDKFIKLDVVPLLLRSEASLQHGFVIKPHCSIPSSRIQGFPPTWLLDQTSSWYSFF